MKNAAAISAQLVDMRNVGAHKSLKLTLHVPEELALKAIAAFGWPTSVNPVPVAIAMLDLEKAGAPTSSGGQLEEQQNSTAPRLRKPVAPEKRLAQQAGILCSDPVFWRFLNELTLRIGLPDAPPVRDEITAAEHVRIACGVKSRSEIADSTVAGGTWKLLHSDFMLWRDHPDLVPDQPATADCQGEQV